MLFLKRIGVVVFSFMICSIAYSAGPITRAKNPVLNQYIVVLDHELVPESVAAKADRLISRHGGQVLTTYSVLFRGFLVRANENQIAALNLDPDVVRIEEDAYVEAATTQSIPAGQIYLPPPTTNASLWGLDRVDQVNVSSNRLDGTFSYCYTGAGVRAYIVDTGVWPGHSEFGGRVDPASSLVQYLNNAGFGLGDQCWLTQNQGLSAAAAHGTAVASVVGGATVGVAKGVTLVDARALDCGGGQRSTTTVARIEKVLEWIPQDPNRGSARRVVNMSFAIEYTFEPAGGSMAQSIATLVDNYNIIVVVAAGNFNSNVWWYIPANAARGICVAGTNKDSDTRWHSSNYGNVTKFYAPSQFIEAASTMPYIGVNTWRSALLDCVGSYPDDTCTSGTSFAAPIVTGVVARYLQRFPSATRDQIVSALQGSAVVYVTDPALGPVPLINYKDCQ